MDIWQGLTMLWNSAVDFMSIELTAIGLNFTLWQFAIGVVVVELLLYAVFRALE